MNDVNQLVSDANKLTGQRVLVTRPAPENQAFCQWVRAQGGEPISFPLIEIAPSLKATPEINAPVSGVIFISKPAINYGFWSVFNAVFSAQTHRSLLACYTVGQASAVHLKNYYEQDHNNKITIQIPGKVQRLTHQITAEVTDRPIVSIEYPSDGQGGEALLRLPRFKSIKNEHWWIVRGGAGLEWLYDEMTERGALVSYWDAYLRKPIVYADEQIQSVLHKEIEVILLFSGEVVQIFESMLACLSIECQNRVKLAKVWVLSDRVANLARKAGFTDIQIITEPFFRKETS